MAVVTGVSAQNRYGAVPVELSILFVYQSISTCICICDQVVQSNWPYCLTAYHNSPSAGASGLLSVSGLTGCPPSTFESLCGTQPTVLSFLSSFRTTPGARRHRFHWTQSERISDSERALLSFTSFTYLLMSSPIASTSSAAVPASRGTRLSELESQLLTRSSIESPNPEAPPLPRKLGEIGYAPPAQSEPDMREVDLNEPSLPARHPADRDHQDESPSSSNPPNPSSSVGTTTTDEESQPKKDRLWSLGGIRIQTYLQLLFLLGLIAGTGGAWWYTVRHLQDSAPTSTSQDQGNTTTNSYGLSSTIFIHAAFSVVTFFELVFLERNIFQIRAERYMLKHGMSPQARRAAQRAATLGIAPWNRPPLPTYAAALAESGRGTGDVEDNLSMLSPYPRLSLFFLFLSISGVDLLSPLQSQFYLPQLTEILGVASYYSHRCSPAASYAPSAVHHRGANATLALAARREKWRKAGGVDRSAMAHLKRSSMLREHASSRSLWPD